MKSVNIVQMTCSASLSHLCCFRIQWRERTQVGEHSDCNLTPVIVATNVTVAANEMSSDYYCYWLITKSPSLKTLYLWHSWALSVSLKHSEASFSPISTDSVYLWVSQMPRCGNLAIFVMMTDDRRQTDRQTDKTHCFTVCAQSNNQSLPHAHWLFMTGACEYAFL